MEKTDRETTAQILRWSGSVVQRTPEAVVLFLDWIVAVAERLVVISVAFVAFYAGWQALSGGTQKSTLTEALKVLSDNWKGLLLLLIPLFYRTVRTFLERVKKFAGMETETEEKRTANPGDGE